MILYGETLEHVGAILDCAAQEGRIAPIASAMMASHLDSLCERRQFIVNKSIRRYLRAIRGSIHNRIDKLAASAQREIKEMADTARLSLGQKYRRRMERGNHGR